MEAQVYTNLPQDREAGSLNANLMQQSRSRRMGYGVKHEVFERMLEDKCVLTSPLEAIVDTARI